MTKLKIGFVVLAIITTIIPVVLALVYMHYSSIEGRYVGCRVQLLDSSARYIELRDGDIHVYAVHSHDVTSEPVYEGIVGAYVYVGGEYELRYFGKRFSRDVTGVDSTIIVTPSLRGLNVDQETLYRLELAERPYRRLYFWSLWWND